MSTSYGNLTLEGDAPVPITVEYSAGTGYVWSISIPSEITIVNEQIGDDGSNVPGGVKYKTWWIKRKDPEQKAILWILLTHYRPWETDPKLATQFILRVD